jgi:hypothetical protein
MKLLNFIFNPINMDLQRITKDENWMMARPVGRVEPKRMPGCGVAYLCEIVGFRKLNPTCE